MTLLKNLVLSLVQRHMIWIFRQLPTSCQRLVGGSSIDCVLRWLIETSNSAAVYLCQTSVNGWRWGGGDRRVPNRLWLYTSKSDSLALPVPVVTSLVRLLYSNTVGSARPSHGSKYKTWRHRGYPKMPNFARLFTVRNFLIIYNVDWWPIFCVFFAEILKTSELSQLTSRIVRSKLEEKFNVSLRQR